MTHWQAWCEHRNSAMPRDDIEWAVGPDGGPYLRNRQSWTENNARQIARRSEEERRKWKWRHDNPNKLTGSN